MDKHVKLTPWFLVIGLGSILLVSGCAWAGDKLTSTERTVIPAADKQVAAEPAAPAPELAFDQASAKDDGKQNLTVKKGADFKIELEGNMTTGFSWLPAFDDQVVKLVSQDYRESTGDKRLVGAGGTQVFVFRGLKAGQTEIKFNYARPWESVQPAKTATYKVTVE